MYAPDGTSVFLNSAWPFWNSSRSEQSGSVLPDAVSSASTEAIPLVSPAFRARLTEPLPSETGESSTVIPSATGRSALTEAEAVPRITSFPLENPSAVTVHAPSVSFTENEFPLTSAVYTDDGSVTLTAFTA